MEWHKFTKKTKPEDDRQIIVCREFGHEPFCVVVHVYHGRYSTCNYHGLAEFIPEFRDRWAYIPMPEA